MQLFFRAVLIGSLSLSFNILLARGRSLAIPEHHQSIPYGWRIAADAPPNETLRVSIAIRQPRMADLEAYMLRNIDHRSNASLTHLSIAQLAEYQAPHDNAARRILGWLTENGIQDARKDGSWVRMNASVDSLRRLLHADISYYVYRNITAPVLRTRSYSIPADLVEFVDFVHPLAHFMPPANSRPLPTTFKRRPLTGVERRQQRSRADNGNGCDCCGSGRVDKREDFCGGCKGT